MANSRTGTVIYVDTTGYSLDQKVKILAVKYMGNTDGTVVITAGTTGSGSPVWEASGATDLAPEEICARVDGFHVAITNGAAAYIYLES